MRDSSSEYRTTEVSFIPLGYAQKERVRTWAFDTSLEVEGEVRQFWRHIGSLLEEEIYLDPENRNY